MLSKNNSYIFEVLIYSVKLQLSQISFLQTQSPIPVLKDLLNHATKKLSGYTKFPLN